MQYYPDYKDINLYAKTNVNVRTSPTVEGSNIYYTATKGSLIGYTTGFGGKIGSILWIELIRDNRKLYVSSAYVEPKKVSGGTLTKDEAQKLLDQLILLDGLIYNKIILLYQLAKAKNDTEAKAEIEKVLSNLIARQQSIKQSQFVTKLKTGTFEDKIIAWLKVIGNGGNIQLSALTGFRSGMGAIPLVPILVGAFLVVATVAVVKVLQKGLDESKKDFKRTKELESIYDEYNIPKDAQKKIESEAEKQVKAAFLAGGRQQWWKNTGGLLKAGLFVTGGVLIATWGIPKLLEKRKRNKKEND